MYRHWEKSCFPIAPDPGIAGAIRNSRQPPCNGLTRCVSHKSSTVCDGQELISTTCVGRFFPRRTSTVDLRNFSKYFRVALRNPCMRTGNAHVGPVRADAEDVCRLILRPYYYDRAEGD